MTRFVATLFLFLLLSGCVEPRPSSEDEVIEPFPLYQPTRQPVLVNATANGTIVLEIYREDRHPECVQGFPGPYEYDWKESFSVYDRYGRISEVEYGFAEGERELAITISLTGEAPHLFAGKTLACTDLIDGNRLLGITNGTTISKQNYTDFWEEDVSVHIPRGQTSGKTEWTPDEKIYALYNIVFETWVGDPHGETRIIDAHGRVAYARDNTNITTAFVWGGNSHKVPGTYTAQVELMYPAVEDTVWTYRFSTARLSPAICTFGFAFDPCSVALT